MFTCTRSKGHGLWSVIGGFRSVLFVSCFKVRYFVLVLFQAIIDELSLLRRFFWSFLFLSLTRIKQPLPLPSTKNPLTIVISFAILKQSRVFLSQAGRARYLVSCINPAFTKMIDVCKYAQRDTTNFSVNAWLIRSITTFMLQWFRIDSVSQVDMCSIRIFLRFSLPSTRKQARVLRAPKRTFSKTFSGVD